jgi:MerR family transcriptional regulator/heat shock protein HspR
MQPSGDEPVYVISVAARLANLQPWVLRVLDQEGVVVPTRTDSNRRLYSDNDILLLSRVRFLMEVEKVNIPGVKLILAMEQQQKQRPESATTSRAAEKAQVVEVLPPPNGTHLPLPPPDIMEELALAIPEVTEIVSTNEE